ncbi:MAG: hypothetical protein ACRDRX_06810 [Pseudonocardiaceae bacterium]
MSVRTGVAMVSLGVLAGACSTAPGSSAPEPRVAPSPGVEAAEPETSEPGVSWLRVAPQEGLRGATVLLDVACLDNLGPVRSPVLDVGALASDPAGHQPWHQTGSATVHFSATPGSYPISVTCGTEQLSAVFTVVPNP